MFWEKLRTLEKNGIGRSPFPFSRNFEIFRETHWFKYFMRCFIWVLNFFIWVFIFFLCALNFVQYFMWQHQKKYNWVLFFHLMRLSHVFHWRDDNFAVEKIKPGSYFSLKNKTQTSPKDFGENKTHRIKKGIIVAVPEDNSPLKRQ